MKNVLTLFAAAVLLIISSCKDKEGPAVAVTGISLSKDFRTLVEKETFKLEAIITPEDAADKSIEWASTSSGVATVADGVVTAVKAGTTTITAKSKSNTSLKAAKCTITVVTKKVDATAIKINPAPASVTVGDTLRLKAAMTPADASDNVEWTSSEPAKATVSSSGLVKGLVAGTVTITAASARDKNIKGECQLTVTTTPIAVTALKFDPDLVTLPVGGKQKLTITIEPKNATNQITYSSSDPKIVSVDSEGSITAESGGTAEITAATKDGKITAKCTVNVGTPNKATAALLTMTLGNEQFRVTLPAEGEQDRITVAHAPRTISSILGELPVTLTATSGATFKIGTADFTSGGNVNFSGGEVTITVTSEDKITTRPYTVTITAYNRENNPYGVYTAAHLNDVRNDKGGSYLMMNDITLPDRNEEGKTATGIEDYAEKGWQPIGHDAGLSSDVYLSGGFTGTFDGGNFSIGNFYFNRSAVYIGLFAIADGATIRNLGLTGTKDADASKAADFSRVGVLAGYVKKGSISNCYTSADISLTSSLGGSVYAGGLLGYSLDVAISKSYSSGNIISGSVTAESLSMGGFAGSLSYSKSSGPTISDCFATGNCTASSSSNKNIYGGGFSGRLSVTTTNCYATGNVVVTTNDTAKLGGFVGQPLFIAGTYTNCYRNSGATLTNKGTAVTSADGRVGITGITAKTMTEMQSGDFANTLGSAWGYDSNKNGGLPYIKGVGVGK